MRPMRKADVIKAIADADNIVCHPTFGNRRVPYQVLPTSARTGKIAHLEWCVMVGHHAVVTRGEHVGKVVMVQSSYIPEGKIYGLWHQVKTRTGQTLHLSRKALRYSHSGRDKTGQNFELLAWPARWELSLEAVQSRSAGGQHA